MTTRHDYIKSEQFITDGLLRECQGVITTVVEAWDRGNKVTGFVLSWPSVPIKSDEGRMLDKAILMELQDIPDINAALKLLIRRTHAYALFLVEVKDTEVTGLFESIHGTRKWSLPIERHGDRKVLGDQKIVDNKEYLGFFWSPKVGSA